MRLTLINNEDSEDDPLVLYYFHIELLNADEIALAHKVAVEALEYRQLDPQKRVELLWFFVRYDDGYKYITNYCNNTFPFYNDFEKRELAIFLTKLIELDYLQKLDLSVELISSLVQINSKI